MPGENNEEDATNVSVTAQIITYSMIDTISFISNILIFIVIGTNRKMRTKTKLKLACSKKKHNIQTNTLHKLT